MAKHQVIYTSCMRGIDGVNDGQQIFSYDESFRECKTDEVKGLFTYQVPALPAGVLMSEEIAKTMPVSFMYRALKSGDVSLTLSTYLGRDYMGSAGRFGNHLSHSIVCDFNDFDVYPCEMYASTALRSYMEYEEVNNPETPDYLPEPELIRGYVIEPDAIVEFLGINDNLEYYKKMLIAMLKFQTEKKRIVICDEPDNIIKWIAALHYALPLDIAKKVNFTTYEFDPELSSSQICGVISEGTRYNAYNYASSNRPYVFDFINNQFTDVETDNTFLNFIDMAMSFSYESLVDFQNFGWYKTTYRECNEQYCASYYLYTLLSDGISELSIEEFRAITNFADEFLDDEVKQELVYKLVGERDVINQLDNSYAMTVLGYLLKSLDVLDMNQQLSIKQMVVDRLIYTLSMDGIEENEFLSMYDSIDEMARSIYLSIPAELMKEHNRGALFNLMSYNVALWKVCFIVCIISDYVKDTKVSTEELYPDCAIGALYYGVVKLVYETGNMNGREVVEKILNSFQDNSDYYVNMTLNIEGFLNDLGLSTTEIEYLWSYFAKNVSKMDASDIYSINRCLSEYERYDEMYMLYQRTIQSLLEFGEIRDYFIDYWNRWFKNSAYGQAYAVAALKDYEGIYEKKISTIAEKERFSYATEILSIATKMHIKDDYVDSLCQAVCEYIPLEKLSDDNKKIIADIYGYNKTILQKEISGKLLLFVIAIKLNKITSKSNIHDVADSINEISQGAKFSGMDEGKIKDYFDWAFEEASRYHLTSDHLTDIFEMFQFGKISQGLFMEYWCKVTYKHSKGDKDYEDFAEFLAFMFANGNNDDQEMVGKYLCKLNKQKLEDLDEEMRLYFKRDRKATHAWENVREVASSTNPLLNNLSGLFKRK